MRTLIISGICFILTSVAASAEVIDTNTDLPLAVVARMQATLKEDYGVDDLGSYVKKVDQMKSVISNLEKNRAYGVQAMSADPDDARSVLEIVSDNLSDLQHRFTLIFPNWKQDLQKDLNKYGVSTKDPATMVAKVKGIKDAIWGVRNTIFTETHMLLDPASDSTVAELHPGRIKELNNLLAQYRAQLSDLTLKYSALEPNWKDNSIYQKTFTKFASKESKVESKFDNHLGGRNQHAVPADNVIIY